MSNFDKKETKLIKNSSFFDQMWKILAIGTNKILTDTDYIINCILFLLFVLSMLLALIAVLL